jgi:hypothetical protein
MDELHKLAKALLEYEMLSGDEIKGFCAASRSCATIKATTNRLPRARPFRAAAASAFPAIRRSRHEIIN